MIKYNKNQLFFFITTILFISAFTIFFINFKERMVYGPEQGLSLIISADYITNGISLLGLPNLQRITSDGHVLFSGSLFNYSLIPQLLIFNYDPYLLTIVNALILFSTGLILFYFTKKHYGKQTALLATIFFFFNSYIIYHATFIWILNYLPLIGLLTFILLTKYQNHRLTALFVGILTGIGFNLQYMYLFTALVVIVYLMYSSKRKFASLTLFIIGAIIGNLPMIIFDLRNQFYHFWSLFNYLIDALNTLSQNRIAYYHFLQWWPILAITFSWLLQKLEKKQIIPLVALYIIANLTSPLVNFSQPINMPPGITYNDYVSTASLIASQNPDNFNVTSLLPYDSPRAYTLRYLLSYKHGFNPQDIEAYDQSDQLFVLALKDSPISPSEYETRYFQTDQPTILGNIGTSSYLLQIKKQQEELSK